MNLEIEDTNVDRPDKPVESKGYPRVDQMDCDFVNNRWRYLLECGHTDYVRAATRCDRMYSGTSGDLTDPGQWELDDWLQMVNDDRKPVEQNEIKPMVNSAIGYQISNRMDVQVLPRGMGADEQTAKVMGKIIKQVLDNNSYHWVETNMFADGMIRQRGFVDIRMSFDENIFGEIKITELDSADVIPDDMGRTYEPERGWRDVVISRWLCLDDIEADYGPEARELVKVLEHTSEDNIRSDEVHRVRSRFGRDSIMAGALYWYDGDDGLRYYNVIDRQKYSYETVKCAIYPTGDIRPIGNETPEKMAALEQAGAWVTERKVKIVRWFVATANVVLFDDISPYRYFTIVPYFPYFRNGVTRGIVDAAIGPQEGLNKALSTTQHIANSVANTGWIAEMNSLSIPDDQFRAEAAKNGVTLFVKPDAGFKPEKLPASPVPAEIINLGESYRGAMSRVTGMDESLTAAGPVGDESGIHYQARNYAAQQKLGMPLDNLGRTRHMVGRRVISLIQDFMTAPQIFRITEDDEYGKPRIEQLPLNQPQPDGSYMNDMTLGEYDLVISEQPMQITFDNSQFKQVETLVAMGYPIPPEYALRYSNLADKGEIAEAIKAASQSQPDPLMDAKVELLRQQALKTGTEAVNKRIEAAYGATQAGAQIAAMPAIASIADEILQSAGFDDQNATPIIPQNGAGLADIAPAEPVPGIPVDQPTNTNPTTPANPGVGLREGIEEPGVQL